MKSIRVISGASNVEEYVLQILSRKLRERGIEIVSEPNEETLDLELTASKLEKLDSFQIEKVSCNHIKIIGDGQRGLIYGIGKFLRECEFGNGEFIPCSWTGTSAPLKPIRGIYFASHFYNFYHVAPVELINEYVEDLALWGCNAVRVWYDMHHYTGIDDPEAQKMIERLKIILNAAKRIGLYTCFVMLANEGYSTTPEHLKSIPTQTAHYGVEICPSTPEGMELIVKLRREMLETFKDVEPDIFGIGPYDQGGCTCGQCYPWGYKGFLKTSEAISGVMKEMFPNAKIILSTWCFDYFVEDEYKNLDKAIKAGEVNWADYLEIDSHTDYPQWVRDNGVPGGMQALNFPEISMYNMYPWGGFGANPLPEFIQKKWDMCGHLLAGGFPYSEGRFEDINKAICLQLYWDPIKRASGTIEEYARYEFGADPEKVRIACSLLEADQEHWTRENAEPCYLMVRKEHAEECYELVQEIANTVPLWAKKSWRWRVFEIRAKLDAIIAKNHAPTDPEVDAMFEELSDMYFAQIADFRVSPPSKRHLKRIWGDKNTSQEKGLPDSLFEGLI